jgi:hypothetical protein
MTPHVPPMAGQNFLACSPPPRAPELDEAHRMDLLGSTTSCARGVAYRRHCHNYVMCIEGQTRVFKTSESGREILLYQVGPGETCVLTTSCLMAGSPFPAESTAETDVLHAALPARSFHRLMSASPRFRKFVLDNYGDLLSSLICSWMRWRLRASISDWPGGFSPRPTSRAWWQRPTSSLRSI